MCKWGNTELRYVFIPAHLSHTSKDRWDYKKIDACIADLVETLNNAGIYTIQSCCGHGRINGSIQLLNGIDIVLSKLCI